MNIEHHTPPSTPSTLDRCAPKFFTIWIGQSFSLIGSALVQYPNHNTCEEIKSSRPFQPGLISSLFPLGSQLFNDISSAAWTITAMAFTAVGRGIVTAWVTISAGCIVVIEAAASAGVWMCKCCIPIGCIVA